MVADQLSKHFAPSFGYPIYFNHGISFGLVAEVSWLALVVGMVGVCVLMYRALHPVILGLLIGSAFSNVVDRIAFGGVRDWLTIPSVVFSGVYLHNNLADIMLFVAICAAVVQFAHGERPHKASEPSTHSRPI